MLRRVHPLAKLVACLAWIVALILVFDLRFQLAGLAAATLALILLGRVRPLAALALLFASTGGPAPARAQKEQVETLSCTVAYVIDGDSFNCRDGTKIRLLLVNAPESGPFGDLARRALVGLLPVGETFRIEFDRERRDVELPLSDQAEIHMLFETARREVNGVRVRLKADDLDARLVGMANAFAWDVIGVPASTPRDDAPPTLGVPAR